MENYNNFKYKKDYNIPYLLMISKDLYLCIFKIWNMIYKMFKFAI